MKSIGYTLLCLLGVSLLSHCSGDKGKGDVGLVPNIRNVNPRAAAVGDRILIVGSNFGDERGIVTVAFDNREAEILSLENGKIQAVVPPSDVVSSSLTVTVADRSSNVFPFTYVYPTPEIESLSEILAAEGTEISITGTGFGNRKEDVTITFGEKPANIVSVSEHSIKVIVPDFAGKRTVEVVVKVKQKPSNKIDFSYLVVSYRNPVSTWSLPDPTLIKAADGRFYLYATEDTRNMPIMTSQNLIDWTFHGTAFTDANRPTFEPDGGLWAPDINYINGRYVMYYSMSVWGGEWTCGIGVAVADSPTGPFTDRGKLFRSNEINVQNSIDPAFIEDDGKKYLFWGSFRGIYKIEMSDDGLSVKTGVAKQQVAGTAFEGVYIHKRAGYYYMFASIGSCCNGLNSTYQLVVGRSTNLSGPYVNKSGTNMMSNGYTLLVSKNASFVGNGHCSQIVQDKEGNDWIFYHGFRTDNPTGRVLLLDQLHWDEYDWPYIGNSTPSITAAAPVFD
ncbi:family 43 glycosylhydrolase [Sphingobacterium chuzhouense]|uniref:Family 43 glycosylhydrolase n=1 Tax=Sphingobacterium chuzhouense TaxID=1742264 RepID=A0ABR7XNY5_9SPHI|nr:family 43 glycosylhydrolase [Sphingobacterium chuzhouense]MBD1420886.1 family 43 glycosylhydrolase [Sphingobacterium chuzhouense]